MLNSSEMSNKYSEIFGNLEADMLLDADTVLMEMDLWRWLGEIKHSEDRKFIIDPDENLKKILAAMKTSHSGSSFGWTMHVMKKIVDRGGWENYKAVETAKWPAERPVCMCRSNKGKKLGWCGVAGRGIPGCEH